MTKTNRPVAIDIFSGVGGMSLGVEASGFDIAVSVELDPIHSVVHKFNFPYGETICSDIKSVDYNKVYDALSVAGHKSVALVVGGPPCQGFSQIGKRQLNDPRNSLVYEYCKFIDALRPKYFIFENVPGIFAGKQKAFVEALLKQFSAIGYASCVKGILNAADYGVAQARKRFIIIGSADGELPVGLPDATHAETVPPLLESLSPWVGTKAVLEDLANIPAFIGDDKGIPIQKMDYSNERVDFLHRKGNGKFSLCHSRNMPSKLVYGHLGSKHTEKSISKFRNTECGKTEKTSRFFKLHPRRPSNTLRAGTASDRGAYTAPRPIHFSAPRCITVREAARLHSYPDWFTFHNTIWHGFREIGNSVAPLFAKALATKVIDALGVSAKDLPVKELPPANTSLLKMNMTEASEYFGVEGHIAPRRRLNGK